jgi:putative hemin transport protein
MNMINDGLIKQKWDILLKENPNLRIRNAAKELGVSEGYLLQLNLGKHVTRLNPNFIEILNAFESLGEVIAITRNNDAVIECHGIYKNILLHHNVILVMNDLIDLRIFIEKWHAVFAVEEFLQTSSRLSFQFFDALGNAVHKVYLNNNQKQDAFYHWVNKFKSQNQLPNHEVSSSESPHFADPDRIDINLFQQAWLDLKDTHDFQILLRRFDIQRNFALKIAPNGMTRKLSNNAILKALNTAADNQTEIMIFVGNPSCLQIFTGYITRILKTGEWINILDEKFNLHLLESEIHEVWHVIKPTTDGPVSSIECFNEKGDLLIQLFGKRKPGIPELNEWRNLCNHLI